jgi:hypothetical protein
MGMNGTARGKTKEEAWKDFLRADDHAKGSYLERDFPTNKQEAYQQMKWNEEKQQFELRFHFDN